MSFFIVYTIAMVSLSACWYLEGRGYKYRALKHKAIKLSSKYDDNHEIHDFVDELFQ